MKEYEIESSIFSRRQFLQIMSQLFALVAFSGCRRPAQPVLDGTTPIKAFVSEDHSEFLSRWASEGIRDAVLINVDTHDDIVRISDKKIADLKELYLRKNWKAFTAADEHTASHTGLYGVANWIYAGGMLGIFSEVYWLVPFATFDKLSSDTVLRQFLKDLYFDDQDITTFTVQNSQCKGRINGIPFTICSMESLPAINNPVLLSVDVDFFPTGSAVYKSSYLKLLHMFFTKIYAKKYKVLDAAVCYSINGEYLNPYLRWVGDAVTTILANPGMIVNDAPSELLSLQQRMENAYRSGDGVELLSLSTSQERQLQEPSIKLYQAFGYMLQGDTQNAFISAMECSRIDRRYAGGLQYLGILYLHESQYRTAEQFFRAGLAADPEMTTGLLQFGYCLQKLGALSEALKIYERDTQVNGFFPCQFMIADVQIRLEKFQDAERTLRDALRHLEMYRAPRISNRPAAAAVYAILEYCDRNNITDIADTLRRHQMMPLMYKDFPRGS
jgi:tetratricopeptide (TPR) repeat protein